MNGKTIRVGSWKELVEAVKNINLYKKTYIISGWLVKPRANKETKMIELEIKKILLTEAELKDINNPELLEEVDEEDVEK